MQPTNIPRSIRRLILTVSVVGVATVVASEPVGSAITLQAVISDPSGPMDGDLDVRVTLFDAEVAGSAVGGPVLVEDVAVAAGRLMLELDFGDVFDGADRWLHIEVRDAAGGGGFTALRPRQLLRPVPNAAHAAESGSAAVADSAASAGDADTLDGMHAVVLLDWGSLTGVPPGLDDGDDDTLAQLGCTGPGSVPVFEDGGWVCGPEAGPLYSGITVVGPVGDAYMNGGALRAAMDAVPTPSSAAEAWLVLVEPGLYDLGVLTLDQKPWVDLAGSGQSITVITAAHCNFAGADPVGTVNGGSLAEVRDLTVEATCNQSDRMGVAIAVPETATGASLRRVTARALGRNTAGWTAAIIVDGLAATLEDVTAEATGGFHSSSAIVNRADDVMVIDTIGVADSGTSSHGLAHVGGAVDPDPHLVVSRGSFRAVGTAESRGVFIHSASADLQQVSSVGAFALDVDNAAGDHRVGATQLTAVGGVDGQQSGGSLELAVTQSRIWNFGAPTISAGPGVTARVAATQLWGGAVTGSVTCAGVWDETWSFFSSTCP